MRLDRDKLKGLLLGGDPRFWPELASSTAEAGDFEELLFLGSLAKKARARGMKMPDEGRSPLRIAVLGGFSLYPLHELLRHMLEMEGISCEFFVGEFDNYVAEITDADGGLRRFRPEVAFLIPGPQRSRYLGTLIDSPDAVRAAAGNVAGQLLGLCGALNRDCGTEVVLCNFTLPSRRDPGPFRSRTLASDWSFRKLVNMDLGLNAPDGVRICDAEFLASRMGTLAADSPKGWFESKQPGSPAFIVEICREVVRLVVGMRRAPKKVLVLDLDNTVWGGVVADDGIEGIEIGDTSPRGEAFKAFQRAALALKQRGVLLAVCSKNDERVAKEPFEKHPEMVLKLDDLVAFYANWDPKSDNLKKMAAELNLGLDSFVFVDDNPAEIEIVRQFVPDVKALLLPKDPSDYVGFLQDCGLFETNRITREDSLRTGQYLADAQRSAMLSSAADMDSYLESLGMEATVSDFKAADVPRLAQLINKSNQFNLTTRRRTEGEVAGLIADPQYACFSLRLSDRFGDHGLISIVIGRVSAEAMEIDTWIMSCRVLKRQVEDFALAELVRLARLKNCVRLAGAYLPTPKNGMVREFYPSMGFSPRSVTAERGDYTLELGGFSPKPTKIREIRAS